MDVINKRHPYIVEQKTKDERTATADEIDEGGIAHNAGIGVEHLHRNCHQGHATYIGEDVIPEMVDKHITSGWSRKRKLITQLVILITGITLFKVLGGISQSWL